MLSGFRTPTLRGGGDGEGERRSPDVLPDRAEWFSVPVALQKIIPAQRGFVTELVRIRGRSD